MAAEKEKSSRTARQDGAGRTPDAGGGTDDARAGGRPSRAVPVAEVLVAARETLRELTGSEPESFSRVEPDGQGGWQLRVEAVELRRVPDTTSLLGSYEMTLDGDGALLGYRLVNRYERGRPDR
ncbi:gas vesicle protein GvpO [Streptomyces cacaoi]|uniref:gas vesicle protein GvpO n=1 Tax=Streptomyces cacaoi TaxID=1898 RepID=UPI003749E0F8